MDHHATIGTDKSWYQHITLDLVVHLLQRSIFHPFIAWLIPLCQRAVGAPADSTQYLTACAWATFITAFWILSYIDAKLAYGKSRDLEWDEEVVVVTGGASGLGKILAEMYGMRGASIAVLDVQNPDKESEGLAGVEYYPCDVGDAEQVAKAKEQIEKDVRSSIHSHCEHMCLAC